MKEDGQHRTGTLGGLEGPAGPAERQRQHQPPLPVQASPSDPSLGPAGRLRQGPDRGELRGRHLAGGRVQQAGVQRGPASERGLGGGEQVTGAGPGRRDARNGREA